MNVLMCVHCGALDCAVIYLDAKVSQIPGLAEWAELRSVV
jgi:hypothetical protein